MNFNSRSFIILSLILNEMGRLVSFFYFLSFLEGASVMAAELLGAKMMAPYFGTSLYVWSSVLGITLGGLALGYFAGGILSARGNRERNLYIILLSSAVFMVLMPVTAKEIMILTAGQSFLISIFSSTLIFLFPPVFCMGMVSPLIVECIISARREAGPLHSGRTAGTVYAVSTVGGILATFFLGFYCMPVFGLTKPALVMGIMLGIIPFIKLITGRKFLSLIFPLAAFFSFSASMNAGKSGKLLYSSEGMLGQILVVDYPLYENGTISDGSQRILFVNRSTQTIVTFKNGEKSFFEYVHRISSLTPDSAAGKHALILGLGGGSVANMLASKGFEVDAVELDTRMAEVAGNYFDLSEKVNVYVDDARHFLQTRLPLACKYDVILLDAFVGEVNPHHLFTREFFGVIAEMLQDSGTFFINGHGYWDGNAGKGMRSVAKTLVHSDFAVQLIPTREEEDYRNLLFIAKKSGMREGSLGSADIKDLELHGAAVLTDDKPQLEILNAEANRRWREACMNYFLNGYFSRQDRYLFQ